VNAVLDLGGEVVLHGDDYDSAYEHAQIIVRDRNLAFVHPFDDPDVIAGQGTVAVEIMRQSKNEVDAIFVPVGGGGLISGIAVYVFLKIAGRDHP
jgi:threonine dehydratase